jgi:hypothetical protein
MNISASTVTTRHLSVAGVDVLAELRRLQARVEELERMMVIPEAHVEVVDAEKESRRDQITDLRPKTTAS